MDNEPEKKRKSLTFATLAEYLGEDGEILETLLDSDFPFTFSIDETPTVEHVYALLEAWYGDNRIIAGNDEQGYTYILAMPDGFYIVDISYNMGVNECSRFATLSNAKNRFNEIALGYFDLID